MIHPLVYRQPTLAVISTGNELVEPENSPSFPRSGTAMDISLAPRPGSWE